ncbi:MAG: KpsF/GutQ family sugar-phosphate isomerase [Spartobacteria bacterium]|nr:KpsF/GutQ family sugar-phosphate isomerase [Spartobacteria bacterium]
MRDRINDSFSTTIKLLQDSLKQHGKIIVTGIGKNLPIGQKMAATFASTGAPAIVLHPIEALHGDLGLVAATDVVLAMSYSGETEELLNLIPILRRIGVKVIAMTGKTDSALARLSDAVLNVAVEREACPFNMAPTSSTTATLAMGDALALVLLESQGFRKEDYALLHPGGSIGRTLLLKALDIMRKPDRMAMVDENATIKEAVFAMTGARSGSVVIVDNDKTLLGILTDGDLRRLINSNVDLSTAKVSDHMIRNPISVKDDHLAVKVLRLFEEHNIDDLAVVDDQNHILGMIDIQDLPKMKIF